MVNYTLLGLSSFVFIFLKAFQQRNVAFDHYSWIIPVSLLMALVEIYVITSVVAIGYNLISVFCVGFGAGVGALVAALTHKKIFEKGKKMVLEEQKILCDLYDNGKRSSLYGNAYDTIIDFFITIGYANPSGGLTDKGRDRAQDIINKGGPCEKETKRGAKT